MDEIYFCLNLTENEHYIVEDMIRKECNRLDCQLKYYRQLKEGHIPMYREVKVCGTMKQLNSLKKYFHKEYISDNFEENPHKIKEVVTANR